MDLNESNVVGVGIPLLHFLHRVVVVHAQLHVVRARDDPVLAHDEARAAHGVRAHLKTLDESLRESMRKLVRLPTVNIRDDMQRY